MEHRLHRGIKQNMKEKPIVDKKLKLMTLKQKEFDIYIGKICEVMEREYRFPDQEVETTNFNIEFIGSIYNNEIQIFKKNTLILTYNYNCAYYNILNISFVIDFCTEIVHHIKLHRKTLEEDMDYVDALNKL